MDDLGRRQKLMEMETGRGRCMLEDIGKLKQKWANFFTELDRLVKPDSESNEEWSKLTGCQFLATSSVRDRVQCAWHQRPG
jgi:hypothetical protein